MNPLAPREVPAGAPWRERWQRDFEDPERSRLAQLATVDAEGAPEVRTVVLRGLSRDGAPFFAADRRSAKIRAVRSGSAAELCVWWSGPDVQVRLRGDVHVIGEETPEPWASVRSELWERLRPSERRGFAGPAPGTRIPESAEPPESPGDAHPNLVVAVLVPIRFDRVALGDPHRRELYVWTSAGWTGGRVQP